MKKFLCGLIVFIGMLQMFSISGNTTASESATFTVLSASGTVGSTVILDVGIVNNPGFHAMQCQVEYDKSKLQLISITAGEKLIKDHTGADAADRFVYNLGNDKEPARFIYMGLSLDDPLISFTKDGVIIGDLTMVTLVFKTLATGTADVKIKCEEALFLDNEYNVNSFVVNDGSGKITIFENYTLMYGDVNGDGVVNVIDLGMLRKYLSSIDPTTGLPSNNLSTELAIKTGADVNGDGYVNVIDLSMLRKYLASIDPITNQPSFSLGPR